MAWTSNNPLFKSLSDEEEEQFRKHAKEEDPPKDTPWCILHPVCVEEWRRRGLTPVGLEK